MKIISSGKLFPDNTVIFTCSKCGCKFSASPDEYYEESKLYDTLSVTYTISNKTRRHFHANCPECHKMCYEYIDTDNNNIYTTATATPVTTDHIEITCNSTYGGQGD